MDEIDKIVSEFTLKDRKEMSVDSATFVQKFNNDEMILLDIRMPFETAVWGVKFATEIPYNKLPQNLEKLPKDKIIVCACPLEYRANMAKEYLRFKGFNAKTLNGGLLELMNYLRGGQAKEINLK
jgi:rhodanese-related sulfurtransferase